MEEERHTRRIMIVEDDALLGSIYRKMLELHGYPVVSIAVGASDALRQFKEALPDSGKKPEVVIADRVLPDGDGVEVSAALHEIEPTLDIVLATGDGSVTLESVKKTGIRAVLHKPFPISKLLSVIATDEGQMIQEKSEEQKEQART